MNPQNPKPQKRTLLWVCIFAGIALAAILSLLFLQSHQQPGATVTITRDGVLVDQFPLDEDRTVTYPGTGDNYNTICIENGSVRISAASCPDQICVHHKATAKTADPIVCLPNKLVVEVITSAKPDLDGVS